MPGQRRCPVCGVPLTPHTVGPLTVDVCMQCGGVFFDVGELGRAIKSSSLEALEAESSPTPPTQTSPRGRVCPSCQIPMSSYHYVNSSPILLDSCPQCGGIWADDGELHAMAEYANRYVPKSSQAPTAEAASAAAMLDSMTAANRQRAQTLRRAVGCLNQWVYGSPFGGWWF